MRLMLYILLFWSASPPAQTPAAARVAPTPAGKSGETVVTSGSLDVDYNKNTAVFSRDVHVVDGSGEIWADRMEVTFEPRTREVKETIATGRKVITRTRGRSSRSRKAVYTAGDGKVVLTGDPRITQGQNVYTADRIIIFRDSEKVVFEPRARLFVYPDEGPGMKGLNLIGEER